MNREQIQSAGLRFLACLKQDKFYQYLLGLGPDFEYPTIPEQETLLEFEQDFVKLLGFEDMKLDMTLRGVSFYHYLLQLPPNREGEKHEKYKKELFENEAEFVKLLSEF